MCSHSCQPATFAWERRFWGEGEERAPHLIVLSPAEQHVSVGRGCERRDLAAVTLEGQSTQLAHLMNVPQAYLFTRKGKKKGKRVTSANESVVKIYMQRFPLANVSYS